MTTPTARISDRTAVKLVEDLREIKQQENISLVELGKRIGVHENAIAGWFNGLSKPTALVAYHVMNFLSGRETQTNLFENLFTEQVAKADTSMTLDDGTVYLSSRSVAEWVEKRHGHLVRDIENYIRVLGENEQTPILGYGLTTRVEDYFREDSYRAEAGGRAYKFYWCSRRGCELIANKMTGQKGIKFTAHYIEYFHAMEQALKEPLGATEKAPTSLAEAEQGYINALAESISKTSDMAEKKKLANKLNEFIDNLG